MEKDKPPEKYDDQKVEGLVQNIQRLLAEWKVALLYLNLCLVDSQM